METTTQKVTDEQQRGAFTRRQFLKGSGVLIGLRTLALEILPFRAVRQTDC